MLMACLEMKLSDGGVGPPVVNDSEEALEGFARHGKIERDRREAHAPLLVKGALFIVQADGRENESRLAIRDEGGPKQVVRNFVLCVDSRALDGYRGHAALFRGINKGGQQLIGLNVHQRGSAKTKKLAQLTVQGHRAQRPLSTDKGPTRGLCRSACFFRHRLAVGR